MKIVCIIPARIHSTRFPRKLLYQVNEKTLLGHVIEAAKKVSLFDEIVVACCSDELAKIAKEHGVKAKLTDPNISNGTKRMIAAIDQGIEGDVFINWQGDEPFIDESMIKDLLQNIDAGDSEVITLKKKITKEQAEDDSVVKVVCDKDQKALYFSRSLIPYPRNFNTYYYKHIGLYGFTKKAIEKILCFKDSFLQEVESLEQLCWLENGMKISVFETRKEALGIDTEEDVKKMETLLKG